jgi:hypothetical protein
VIGRCWLNLIDRFLTDALDAIEHHIQEVVSQ